MSERRRTTQMLIGWLAVLLIAFTTGCDGSGAGQRVVLLGPPPDTPTPIMLVGPVAIEPPAETPTPTSPPTNTPAPTLTPEPTHTQPATATRNPASTPTLVPSPTEELPPPAINRSRQIVTGGLVLQEYPVAAGQGDLGDCSVFGPIADRLNKERWHNLPAAQMMTVDEVNQIISPFGYFLDGPPPSTLYKGSEPLREILFLPMRGEELITNPSKTNFAWFIKDTLVQGWLVQRDRIDRDWNLANHFFTLPQFRGDDLVTLWMDRSQAVSLQVQVNGEPVYQVAHTSDTTCPVEGLRTSQDQWVLNLENQVIVEGAPLTTQAGYDQVFEWSLLGGKPLYFFQDGSQAGLVYAGAPIALKYDAIWQKCIPPQQATCEQPKITARGDLVWFFGLRQGEWHYVEVRANP